MSFAILILLLVVALILKAADSAKWANANRKFYEKERAVYKPANTYVKPEEAKVSYRRDYVGEFEYANKLYQDIWNKFKLAHPIGDFYDYNDWDKGRQTILLETEKDQRRAFELEYKFSRYGHNGPEYYCLWEARRDAVRRGYAPDNVTSTAFYGYDAKKEPGHQDLNTKAQWVPDEKYNPTFYLTTGMPNTDYKCEIAPRKDLRQRENLGIFIFGDPQSDSYRKQYEQVKAYLQARQERENKITEHRIGHEAATTVKPVTVPKDHSRFVMGLLGTIFLLCAIGYTWIAATTLGGHPGQGGAIAVIWVVFGGVGGVLLFGAIAS